MTQNNRKIAITGGIGSGKSTVAEIIARQGFSVISCDEIYKQLLQSKDFLDIISSEFDGVVTDDGKLDRKKLSTVVFSDKQKLEKLNSITHPAIMNEAFEQMQSSGIHFCEVPLLFECGYEKYFDNVIVVLRDKDKRISDIVKRDNKSVAEANLLINSQFDYDNCLFEKYYVIHNDGGISDLQSAVLKIIKDIED